MDCSVYRKAIVMRPGISLMHLDIRRPAWSSSALVYRKRISEQERGRGNVARCRCRGRGRGEVYRGEMVMLRRRIDPSLSASHNQTSDQTVPAGLSTSKGQNEPVFLDHMVTPWLCSALCCLLYTARGAYGIGTVRVRMYAFFGIAPVSITLSDVWSINYSCWRPTRPFSSWRKTRIVMLEWWSRRTIS